MLQYHQGMFVAVGGSSGNTPVHNNDGKEGQWLLRQKHNCGKGKNQGNKAGVSTAVIEQVEGVAARGPLLVACLVRKKEAAEMWLSVGSKGKKMAARWYGRKKEVGEMRLGADSKGRKMAAGQRGKKVRRV
ncbi:hypothetical protein B296_00033284 [Ensete ventricosum]|uniref:Uncharacterized protein n=1 Tax=Ensete ventricosum TaxID=4639 RepID=A0A426ZX79_ENSVE|nr:hypothetical protein B296_00033284 [Ensete ventricosum]